MKFAIICTILLGIFFSSCTTTQSLRNYLLIKNNYINNNIIINNFYDSLKNYDGNWLIMYDNQDSSHFYYEYNFDEKPIIIFFKVEHGIPIYYKVFRARNADPLMEGNLKVWKYNPLRPPIADFKHFKDILFNSYCCCIADSFTIWYTKGKINTISREVSNKPKIVTTFDNKGNVISYSKYHESTPDTTFFFNKRDTVMRIQSRDSSYYKKL